MANTKANKTVKRETVNKVVEETPKTESPKVEVEVAQPKKKKEIDRDSLIACYNLTSGNLIYISRRTGLQTVWTNYGDVEYVDFAELLTMKASQPKFLNEPWIFVEDEEAVNQLGLKELYKNLIPVHEVDDFFNLNVNEAREILPKLPKGMKELISEKARKGISDGSVNNLQLIRLLEQELQLDLISLMD